MYDLNSIENLVYESNNPNLLHLLRTLRNNDGSWKSDAIQTITLLRELTNINPHWAQGEQVKELDRDLVQSYSRFQSLFEQKYGRASIVPQPPKNNAVQKRVGTIIPCSSFWYSSSRFSNFRASLVGNMVELVWDYSLAGRDTSKLVFNVFRDGKWIALVAEAGYQDFDIQEQRTFSYTIKSGSIQSEERIVTVQSLDPFHNHSTTTIHTNFSRDRNQFFSSNGAHQNLEHSSHISRWNSSSVVYPKNQQQKKITLDIVNFRYLDNSFGEVLTERMKRLGIECQINKYSDIHRQEGSPSNAVLHISLVVGAPNLFDYSEIVANLRAHSSTNSVIHMVLVNLRVRQGVEWEYWNLQKQEFPSGVHLEQPREKKRVIYLAVFKSEADMMCIDMQYQEKNEEQLKILEELLQSIAT